MPAPSPTQIQTFLTQALLAKGFTKKSYVNGALVVDGSRLPDKLADLISGLSNGLSRNWTAWQASQTVSATDTVTSAPVVGLPGQALP
jgi:alpha-glucuronidase